MFSYNLLKNVVGFVEEIGKTETKTFSLSIDSRTYKKGDAFFAIKGPNFDGINYASSVVTKQEACRQ